ncbi:MAG TPA: radical SAM protein [Methylocella sp.]
MERFSKRPVLLCIVPPYSKTEPPAAPAYLTAFLKQQGCDEFGFIDLRLAVPDAVSPTYTHTSVFGDSFVMDIPDLPLVLKVLDNFMRGRALLAGMDEVADEYALHRGIPAVYLKAYLASILKYLSAAAQKLAHVRFIGFSVWTSNYLTTLLFCCCLKRLEQAPRIVLGGPQVTQSDASAALALKSGVVDVVALGEGEQVLLDLYTDFIVNRFPAEGTAAGSRFLQPNGTIASGSKRTLLPIAGVRIPDFSGMAITAYQQNGWRTLPYHFSRGCTDRCVFCSEWQFWERFRPGEVENTVEGFLYLARHYGAEEIAFTDSLLNGHPKRLVAFAEELLRQRNKTEWSGFMRANMDIATARLLKRAGCYSVFVGIESMADETLAAMKKRRTEADNIKALEAFLSAGISVVAGIIPGFPTDKRSSFVHTIEILRSLQIRHPGKLQINVEPFIISPGQAMSKALEHFGLRGVPWSDQVCQIAPSLSCVAASVLCSVEGENQGQERSGRLLMASALETGNVNRADVFDYKTEETVRTDAVFLSYLTSSRHLAQWKTARGHVVSLIVDEQEKELLEDIAARNTQVFVSDNLEMAQALRTIRRAHKLKPFEDAPVDECHFSIKLSKTGCYYVSPYVIARRLNERRWLICHTVTGAFRTLSNRQWIVLETLGTKVVPYPVLRRIVLSKSDANSDTLFNRIVSDLLGCGFVCLYDPQSDAVFRMRSQPSIELGNERAVPKSADTIEKHARKGGFIVAHQEAR